MSLWTELLVILGLILLSGVFAGAEIALLSVRKTRLGELAADGHTSARAALDLRENPERLLATLQVAITVLGAATAVFGGSRLEEPLAELLVAAGAGSYAPTIAFIVVVGGISYFSLVMGELVPKSLALRKSESFTLFIARLLVVVSKLARPAVWLLTVSSNLVLRVFRDSTTFSESRLSPDELQQLVEEAATTGTLSTAAGEIASRAIDLAGLRVRDILVPRSRVVAIPVASTREQVVEVLQRSPHARYPVYDQTIDNVLGYVTTRELYDHMLASPELELRKLVRPLLFVPDTTPVVQAMRRFQEERQRFALVVDETGGVVGVITIGDVSEELLGEVLDEHETPEQFVRKEAEGMFSVRGDAPIHEVERALSLTLADDDTRSATIAGLVIERLGHIPKRGEQVALTGELEVEVTDASERRIRSLMVRLHPAPTVSA